MIDIKYSKAILNLLFGKNAAGSGMTKEAEKRSFLDQGIPMQISSEEMLEIASLADDSEEERAEKQRITSQRVIWMLTVNRSTYWQTQDLPEATKKHTYTDEYGDEQTQTIKATGWKIVEKKNVKTSIYYPHTRYLALFTTMPDADGQNFVEPFYGADSVQTTYKRVDLDKGYFSQDQIMCAANHDEEKGGASTNNTEVIYYPEIVSVDWATSDKPLVGFGIFENETPQDGEVPYLWGTLSNTGAVTAKVDHIPLFRVGEFQLSIS